MKQHYFFNMDAKDCRAADPIRPANYDLAVEAPRPQQRRIENFGAIGRGKKGDAFARVKAVELHEQLVQRLLLLVMTAPERTYAARPAHCVELVDED